MKDKKQTLTNVLTVIIGCLLMGFLWRIRGEHGWGAAWGVLNAGFIYSLFVVLIKGAREKFNIGWLAVTSISFMLTVPAWGTILDQITGVLVEAEFNNGSPVYVSIFSERSTGRWEKRKWAHSLPFRTFCLCSGWCLSLCSCRPTL